MLFNSLEFAIFLPVIFILYWFVAHRNLKVQNALLIAASYFFYGMWDWRFLSLIAFSSLVDYCVGILMKKYDNVQRKRKLLLFASIAINIGFLGFFKYYNFFVDSFSQAFTLFGEHIATNRLNIILPVGISFYTFQTLSYSIDVYRRKLEPTKDVLSFFAYVSFFPQLVAGPIERATNLLPQFYKKRKFDLIQAKDGMRQILWGLFKKIVIADNCAKFANEIFNNYTDYSGSTLFIGAILFSFQIYGDFSGYSDIAIGTSRLFGFNLMQNFAFPYFSRNIGEFWRRWHISLSTWFRDYIYIPLGGSKIGKWHAVVNVMIIFLISGFWHGANWTFIVWGLVNAIWFLPSLLIGSNRKYTNHAGEGLLLSSIREFGAIIFTFFSVSLFWIFFRSNTVTDAFIYINRIFSLSFFTIPQISAVKNIVPFVVILILVEWFQRRKLHGLELTNVRIPGLVRWLIYYAIIIVIYKNGGEPQGFIYFQF